MNYILNIYPLPMFSFVSLSRVRLLATPWTAAYQAPPSMGFSRHEYWSGVPLPSPGAVLQGPKKKVDVLLILMAEYDYL